MNYNVSSYIKEYTVAAIRDANNYFAVIPPAFIEYFELKPKTFIGIQFTAWGDKTYKISYPRVKTGGVTASILITKDLPGVTDREYVLAWTEAMFGMEFTIKTDITRTIYICHVLPAQTSEAVTVAFGAEIKIEEVIEQEPITEQQQQQQQITNTQKDISKDLQTLQTNILNAINNLGFEIELSINNAVYSIVDYISNALYTVSSFIERLFSTVLETILNGIQYVVGIFSSIISNVISTISNLLINITATIAKVASFIVNVIYEALRTIEELITQLLADLLNRIIDAIVNLPDRVANSLSSIIFEEEDV